MPTWKNVKQINSSDTNVSKFVFETDDAVAEAVLYKYPTYEERTVICCSTQSGCPVGCRFCGAGDNFVRSLSPMEIIKQPSYLLRETGIDPTKIKKLQIMFMSMGEPMLNYKNLSRAIVSLAQMYPQARLLISTSAPRVFYKFEQLGILSAEYPAIGLQFSVHETTDEARQKLIPTATMSLAEIAETGTKWFEKAKRKPFFNYCVHEKNNTPEDVTRLRALFDPSIWECTISVICERHEHIAAANERQRSLASDFSGKMLQEGYNVRVFNPAGQDDIGGGCGQLWFVQDWMKRNPNLAHPSKGNGLPVVHTPGIFYENLRHSNG